MAALAQLVPFAQRRRDRRTGNEATTFAAQTVDIRSNNNIAKLQAIKSRTAAATPRAWEWYDGIPELHYGINHAAAVAGHASFQPKKLINGQATELVTHRGMREIYDGIWSPYGGTRSFVEQFFRLMKLKAHAHLLRVPEGGYDWVSDDELSFENGQVRRHRLPMMGGVSRDQFDNWAEPVAPEDYLGRIWRPHPRWLELPDSPMTALDPVCEQLDLLTKSARARLMSRIALNGILFIPTEISEVIASGAEAKDRPFGNDRILNRIVGAWLTNMKDHGNALATMPFLLRGPAAVAEAIRFITTDTEIYEIDLKLRDEAATRMLQGLDIQPSSVEGNGDSNHWAAWADRDEELRSQITPDLELLSFAVDVFIVNPLAEERGIRRSIIDSTVCTPDLTGATARPNLAEDSRSGYDRFAVNAEGVRKSSGVSDEFAPTDLEMLQMLAVKSGDLFALASLLGMEDAIDWEKWAEVSGKTKQPGPDATNPSGKPSAGPGVGDPGAPGKGESDKPKSKRPA